jgi:thiamine transport system ATP-binding protein
MSVALELDCVSVAYDGVAALSAVDLAVSAGETLAVLGPSGCGKSTLIRAVAGLEPLANGAVCWAGSDLAGVPTHRRGFALLFQDGQLFEHYSVAENVGYPLRLRRMPRARVAARVAELLGVVGLDGYAERRPDTLSGGERQRVALARALAVEPRLMLLDEPLSALDGGLRERLAGELRTILEGTTAVWVTHDHEEAFAVADRIAILRAGQLIQDGPTAEVWAHPVDAETALFLGYAGVLVGSPAAVVLRAAGLPGAEAVALRRSALVVSDTGPILGRVESARATPEQVRLVATVADVGRVDAVAPRDARCGPGDRVRLSVRADRLAMVDPRLD